MRRRTRCDRLVVLLFLVAGCGEPGAALDGGASDAGARDAGAESDAAPDDAGEDDAGEDDAGENDAGESDAGESDAGEDDAGVIDAGVIDAGVSDSGPPDSGPPDSGPIDSGPIDSGPVDPCTPLPAGLTTWTRSDSAASGTPDTYILDVNPGDPFCASITGGGSGSWWVNVSNGTSSGVYCRDEPICSILVPAGQTALMVTAVTDDIGYYTLTVRYRPR